MIGSGGTKRVSSRYTATPAASYYPLCGLLSHPLAGFWRSCRVAKNRISSTIKIVAQVQVGVGCGGTPPTGSYTP